MRVLVVTTFSDRPDLALYRGISRAGVEMDLVHDPERPEHAGLADPAIRLFPRKIRHRLDLAAVHYLRTLIASRDYDLIHAPRNGTLSVSLLASIGRRSKIVAYRGTVGHLSRLDPASWLTYLNPRVDRIVCVSMAVESYLRSLGVPPERLVTIYKGHDPAWYVPPHTPASLLDFGIPPGAFVVGFTGNMRPVKGVDVLIAAARLLPPESPVHVLLVGEVRDRSLRRQAADPRVCHRLHFTGFRNDAAFLAGLCDVFVMPSVEREGLPRSVLEAMSQGVPPIVSRVGGMPELVQDRESGLVVPPRDPAALAEAIGLLVGQADLRKSLGNGARRRVLTAFTIQSTIDKTLALYRQLAG